MAVSNYTLAQLQTLVYARLENNTLFWTTAEVTAIINEAIRSSNILCGWYQDTVLMLSVANQLVYNTPAGMLYPQRCQFEGVQLDPVPITRIGQNYRNWATQTSGVYGPVAQWVPIGVSYFCLHPIDSVGGGSIALTGVLEPPLLVLPGDNMSLEDQWVTIIVEYCASRLPWKEGGSIAAAGAQLYQKGYLPAMKARTNLQQMRFPRYFVLAGAPVAEGMDK